MGRKNKKNGFEIRLNMQALIYHKESVTVGEKSALKEFFMNRNRILFIRRNANVLQQIVFYLHFLLLVTPRNILNYIKDKNPDFIIILFRAIWWNLTNKVGSKFLGYKLK